MGLINNAQKKLSNAFDGSLSDVVKRFTLTRKLKGDYNSVSGTYDQLNRNYVSRGVFEDFGTKEINASSEIKIGDVKLIVLTNEISIIPAIDDVIENYTVINTVNVFGITYEVQLRGV